LPHYLHSRPPPNCALLIRYIKDMALHLYLNLQFHPHFVGQYQVMRVGNLDFVETR